MDSATSTSQSQQSSSPSNQQQRINNGLPPDKRYVPTAQERSILESANRSFLIPYLLGIATGVGAGIALSRNVSQTWQGMTIFTCSIGGEYVGRKAGEYRARRVLFAGLPADSKLREALAM
ncbi:hypothetical protein HDU76_004669, partial [Blyttiomyces sp. JEL0837]